MPFEEGSKKAGGRKPGTPNKRTLTLIEVLEQHGYSPVAELIELASLAKQNYKVSVDPVNASNWIKIGVTCATGILPYVYPKRKPAEGDAELTPEQVAKMSNNELLDHAERMIKDFKN
jgi:hypothetical protein